MAFIDSDPKWHFAVSGQHQLADISVGVGSRVLAAPHFFESLQCRVFIVRPRRRAGKN